VLAVTYKQQTYLSIYNHPHLYVTYSCRKPNNIDSRFQLSMKYVYTRTLTADIWFFKHHVRQQQETECYHQPASAAVADAAATDDAVVQRRLVDDL